MASLAELVGDRSRAGMLAALMDGRALTATELATEARVTPATASAHLGKLTRAHLITLTRRGRYRYFRLASSEVAHMLESLMVLTQLPESRKRHRLQRIDPALQYARTCYDHLAGRVAVAIADALESRGLIQMDDESCCVTEPGQRWLRDFGGLPEQTTRARRIFCRPCLDWSERRFHLAGAVGAKLFDALLEKQWLRRSPLARAVIVTAAGRRGLKAELGVDME